MKGLLSSHSQPGGWGLAHSSSTDSPEGQTCQAVTGPPGGGRDHFFTPYELKQTLLAPSPCPLEHPGASWSRLHPFSLEDLPSYPSLPGQQKPKQLSFLHLSEQLQLNTFPIKDPRRAPKHRWGLQCSSLIRSLWTSLPHDPDRIPQSYQKAGCWAQLLSWDPDPCLPRKDKQQSLSA